MTKQQNKDVKFDATIVQKIAHLARLKLTSTEAAEIGDQLAKVLEHFDEISSLDTTGLEPLVTPSEIEYLIREDKAVDEFTATEMVANAPDKLGNLFKVPPVV